MENILDLYQQAYNPDLPVVCMDEASKQLVAETRQPLPTRRGTPARFDHEYERKGTAEIFMFCEPLAAKRWVRTSQRRTRTDWAVHLKWLLDDVYPDKPRIRLVMDNLNTHHIASFYEAFDPATANRLAKRLEIHYTPKHGSWLNIAEIELKVLSLQCLDRRIASMEELNREIAAWQTARGETATKVDWHFTTANARIKLKKLYPSFYAG